MFEKTYSVAGTSLFNGAVTYRFASTDAVKRAKVLRDCGHDLVNFVELPKMMTMSEAVAFLKAQGIEAVLPKGQRLGQNGGPRAAKVAAVVAEELPQLDAHVQDYTLAMAAAAQKKLDFVAKMAAARAAKKLAALAETAAA